MLVNGTEALTHLNNISDLRKLNQLSLDRRVINLITGTYKKDDFRLFFAEEMDINLGMHLVELSLSSGNRWIKKYGNKINKGHSINYICNLPGTDNDTLFVKEIKGSEHPTYFNILTNIAIYSALKPLFESAKTEDIFSVLEDNAQRYNKQELLWSLNYLKENNLAERIQLSAPKIYGYMEYKPGRNRKCYVMYERIFGQDGIDFLSESFLETSEPEMTTKALKIFADNVKHVYLKKWNIHTYTSSENYMYNLGKDGKINLVMIDVEQFRFQSDILPKIGQ